MTKYILPLLMLFGITLTAQIQNDTIKESEELDEIVVQGTRNTELCQKFQLELKF